MIASVSKTSKIVVEKSTVPVKTAEAIEKVIVYACRHKAGSMTLAQFCALELGSYEECTCHRHCISAPFVSSMIFWPLFEAFHGAVLSRC